jgi:phosphoglycolate phosphatase
MRSTYGTSTSRSGPPDFTNFEDTVNTAILFDLDGTLTNPFEGITLSIRHALKELGAHVPEQKELLWCIGPPLRTSFPKLLGTDEPARIEEAIALYRERFASVGLFENTRYDGVLEMLRALKEDGRKLFVATSKPRVYAERIVERFELAPFFTRVYGAELDGRFDHKKTLIAHLIAEEHLEPATTLMVGDREHDVVGARASGIRTVGVTYGYGTHAELAYAGAEEIVASPGEVIGAVREMD